MTWEQFVQLINAISRKMYLNARHGEVNSFFSLKLSQIVSYKTELSYKLEIRSWLIVFALLDQDVNLVIDEFGIEWVRIYRKMVYQARNWKVKLTRDTSASDYIHIVNDRKRQPLIFIAYHFFSSNNENVRYKIESEW